MFTKLYIFARKIHRFLLLLIVVLGVLMSFTGMLLKYDFLIKTFGFLDELQIRSLHNNLSPFFGLTFFIMMLTGVYMYVFPLIHKK